MARFVSGNYTDPTPFEWVDSDGDDPTNFKSPEDLGWVARALNTHTHVSGKGLQIPAGGLAALAVATSNLQATSVTEPKLADDAATARVIADGAIDAAAKVAAGVLNHTHFVNPLTGDLNFGTDKGINLGYGGQLYDMNTGGPVAERTVLLAAGDTLDIGQEDTTGYAQVRVDTLHAYSRVRWDPAGAIDRSQIYDSAGATIMALGASNILHIHNATGAAELARITGSAITFNNNTITGWNSGNDGHNSTLDADTLDTFHADHFAEAAHTHTLNYVPLAGGTMSGQLNWSIDGDAATPVIRLRNSGSVAGFYTPGGGEIGITAGGSARGRFDDGGDMFWTATIHADNFNDTSDERLKQNIEDAPDDYSAIVRGMHVKRFERKARPGVKELGFVAQDMERVFPIAVGEVSPFDEKGRTNKLSKMKSIGIMPVLAAVVAMNQEQDAAIQALNARVSALGG